MRFTLKAHLNVIKTEEVMGNLTGYILLFFEPCVDIKEFQINSIFHQKLLQKCTELRKNHIKIDFLLF